MTTAEFNQALETMDATELALGAGFIGVIGTLMVVGAILWYFLSAVGYYKMYQKAGEAGWKAFVPFLRDYVRFKISWNTKVFWPFAACIVALYLFDETESVAITFVLFAVSIAMIVLQAKLCKRLAASFGKGTGWSVLLFFFPFIVSLILGFGKAEYIGNTTIAAPAAEAEEAAAE